MKTTLLFAFLLAISGVFAQSYLIRNFADSACTDLQGFSYDNGGGFACTATACTQFGSTGQYYTIECDGGEPEVPPTMHSFYGSPYAEDQCAVKKFIYAGIPNVCWIYAEYSKGSFNTIRMDDCQQDGSIPFNTYLGAGACAEEAYPGTITATCAEDTVLTLQYAIAACATEEPTPVAAPTSSAPAASPSASPSAAPTANTPAKKSDAATMTVSGLILIAALI